MSHDPSKYDEEFSDEFTFEEEAELLGRAYEATYLIATGKISMGQLLKDLDAEDDFVFLLFDPSSPNTLLAIIDDVIEYYEEIEDYEKCAELLTAKNELQEK